MWSVIGGNLAASVAMAISITPIIGLIAILTGKRAHACGAGYALGWLVGISASLALFAALSGMTETGDPGPRSGSGIDLIALAFAVLFLILAGWAFRGRPRAGASATEPRWLQVVDRLDAGKAFWLGAAIVVINVKNLPLLVASGLAIGHSGLGSIEAILVVLALGMVASLGALVPVGAYLLAGRAADDLLATWRRWLVRHNAVVMTVVFGVLGLAALATALPS